MAEAQLEQYHADMAGDVAQLIAQAFADHRHLPPLSLLWSSPPFTSVAELSRALSADAICAEASYVVLEAGRPVAAALACRKAEAIGWWRVATAPDRRRRGLASRCLLAGERALCEMGLSTVATEEVVDSRWQAAGAMFQALDYRLDAPERRNITMMVDGWAERAVTMPAGYELATLTEADIEGWTQCRNQVFNSDVGPDWFGQHFRSRPDFDATGWYLAKYRGRIIGIAGALAVVDPRDPAAPPGGQIEYVGVVHEHRGKGLGQRLVSACLNWLAQRGATRSFLITQPFRVPAVRLYEKLGFRTIAAWHRWVKDLSVG
ncbi:MAG: GNAT family N-acetyltransferase [Armatimonadota bacterium]